MCANFHTVSLSNSISKSVLNYLTLLSKSLKKELLLPLLNFLTVLSESYKKKDFMLSRLNHFTLLSKIENFFIVLI